MKKYEDERHETPDIPLHELYTLGVTLQGEIEAAEAVSGERVCSALQDDGAGLVKLHHPRHHRHEDPLVAHVVNSVTEWEVEAVVLPTACSDVPEVSSPGEVLSVLVEADSHDSVSGVEGLLHPVTVVDVNIYVEDSLVVLEELQDGEYNVIDVTESTGLGFLSVVESTSPVDSDVCSLQ